MTTALNICIFGNSHLAALKHGWEAHPDRWPGLAPRFVGAHKGLLLDTQVTDGWLRPSTSVAISAFARLGGGDGIRLADYDAFVVAGCAVALSHAAALHRRMHWMGLPSLAYHADISTDAKLLVSRRAALETLTSRLDSRLGPQFVAHLRAHTNKPILLTSQPRASAALLGLQDPATQAHRLTHASGDGAALSKLSEEAASQSVKRAGGIYIPQPKQTITQHILTDTTYMTGAYRLTAQGHMPQPPEDMWHANAQYGALVLDQLARHFA